MRSALRQCIGCLRVAPVQSLSDGKSCIGCLHALIGLQTKRSASESLLVPSSSRGFPYACNSWIGVSPYRGRWEAVLLRASTLPRFLSVGSSPHTSQITSPRALSRPACIRRDLSWKRPFPACRCEARYFRFNCHGNPVAPSRIWRQTCPAFNGILEFR